MDNDFRATVMFWPVTLVSRRVALRLLDLGVDLGALRSSPQVSEGWREETGETGLTLELTQIPRAADLRALLGLLRREGASYYAWGYEQGEQIAVGYAHSRESPVERTFAILPSGEPLIRGSEVQALVGEHDTLDQFSEALETLLYRGRPLVTSYMRPGRVVVTIEPA